jgi:NAD-dependent DNA ligase
MSPAEAAPRIAQLRAEIARHDELYYRQARPELTDFDYDTLKAELARLEQAFPELARAAGTDTPTARVGDDRAEGFARVKHRQAMTTLDNTYDEAELREFHARLVKALGTEDLAYTVEPKIDGVAVSLTYEHGRLTRAVTRGDGEEGDDVTANVRTIRGLPAELRVLPLPDVIEIRGEIFLREEEFRRINQLQEEAGEAPYANPRNLAAGTLKQLDATLVASRRLEIVLYGLGHCEPPVVESQTAYHDQLRAWGLPVVELFRSVRGIDAAWAAIQELDTQRRGLAYGTDGAVVKLDSFAQQRHPKVGFRGMGADGQAEAARKLSPRWACAYKFAPDRAETRVRDITIQVGRTGALTPVAELEPVLLAGTTVKRATLHNADEIARKDVRVGDAVLVEKAGEIIPAVVQVLVGKRPEGSVPFAFPRECPVCRTAAVRGEGEVVWRCSNPECPEKVRRRIEHFASKAGVDIEGLGRGGGRPVAGEGPDPAHPGPVPAAARSAAALEEGGRSLGGQPDRGDRGAAAGRPVARDQRPGHPAGGGGGGEGSGADVPCPRHAGGGTGGGARAHRRIWREDGRRGAGLVRGAGQSRSRAGSAGGGRGPDAAGRGGGGESSGGQDRRAHRHAADAVARGGDSADRGGRRQGERECEQENALPPRRRGGRLETRESAHAWRAGNRRGGVSPAAGRVAASGPGAVAQYPCFCRAALSSRMKAWASAGEGR